MSGAGEKNVIHLTEEKAKEFDEMCRRQVLARRTLDDYNSKSKTLRKFLDENGEKIKAVIRANRIKSYAAEGSNLRTITRQQKYNPTTANIYEAIEKMYGDPAMVEQIRAYIEDNYVKAKSTTVTQLKVCKLKGPKAGKRPNPNPAPQ